MSVGDLNTNVKLKKTNIDMSTKDELKNETANGTKPVLCAGLIVIVQDWGRMTQNSFCSSEIWHGINTKKYKECQWIEAYGEERHKEIELKAKAIGWDVKYVQLFG